VDFKLLCRAYLADALSGGGMEDDNVNGHDNWI